MAFTTADPSNAGSISGVHPDIIRTHILTRLDGPTLASVASASYDLQNLCSDQNLWRNLCTATWPSLDDPRVRRAISAFPAGYRSFFADSFPFVEQASRVAKHKPSKGLISAVDLYYRGELIYSKVQEMKTENGWFMCSPFRVEILDPKESVPTRLRYPGGDYDKWVRHMEENTTLNWILIDPTRKRAANVSSRSSVTARRNWLTGDLEIRYATVVEGKRPAEVAMVVSWGAAEAWNDVEEEEGGKLHVREVRLEVEDIEGKCLNGRDSLVILQGVMEGKRGKMGRGKIKYEEFVRVKRQWKEGKERRERAKDTGCMIFGFILFLSFWGFILLR